MCMLQTIFSKKKKKMCNLDRNIQGTQNNNQFEITYHNFASLQDKNYFQKYNDKLKTKNFYIICGIQFILKFCKKYVWHCRYSSF